MPRKFTLSGDGGAAYLGGLNALGVNPAGLHTGQLELMSHYQQLALATSLMGAGAALPVRPAGATVALSRLNLRWDAAGAAPGGCLYVVKGRKSGGGVRTSGKFALVR